MMARKKILLIYPGYLFPLIMASQHRVIDMLKTLTLHHEVHFMSFVRNMDDKIDTINKMSEICKNYCPIEPRNYESSFIKRKVIGIKAYLSFILEGRSLRHYYTSNKFILDQIKSYFSLHDFDVIQIEYWYCADIFKNLNVGTLKVLDSHGILHQKKRKEYNKLYNMNASYFKKRELHNYRQSEIEAINNADLFISISEIDNHYIKKNFEKKDSLIIQTGQDLSKFENYRLKKSGDTILFYGGMESKQNYFAVKRFVDKILPKIKIKLPKVKCRIVGNNPPPEIKLMHNGHDFIVEGFVSDVRIPLSKCTVMILPLEIGAGFRSRIVEVMALGIPVVGTHNALDNVGLVNGKHCYVSDNDGDMADHLFDVLNDDEKRRLMSINCKEFVSKNFSLDSTFGKLAEYYSSLN